MTKYLIKFNNFRRIFWKNVEKNIQINSGVEIHMKNKKINNLLKKILVLLFIIYFIYTVIAQQKTLNTYAKEKDAYNDDIEVAQEEQQDLKEMKENINSDEYIEQIAREKLGMYYPNERVYIDIEK